MVGEPRTSARGSSVSPWSRFVRLPGANERGEGERVHYVILLVIVQVGGDAQVVANALIGMWNLVLLHVLFILRVLRN